MENNGFIIKIVIGISHVACHSGIWTSSLIYPASPLTIKICSAKNANMFEIKTVHCDPNVFQSLSSFENHFIYIVRNSRTNFSYRSYKS